MDLKEIAEVKSLVGVAAALGKGPKFLSEWMAKRTEQRYTEFIDAARDGNVFPENAERMTPDDLFAILRSLELDIENEKAMLYGRLASSIAKGDMSADDRRHFIKSLRELTFSQVGRLRRAHVAAEFALKPTIGSGRKEMREYIAGGPSGRLDEAAFKQFTLTDGDKLTDIGIRFVEACYHDDELTPSSIGEREWAKTTIQIICNEISDPDCVNFINSMSVAGHNDAIRVTNGAAMRGRSEHYRILSGSLVVLLYRNPEKLVEDWDVVDKMTRSDGVYVSASFDSNSLLPESRSVIEHFNLSSEEFEQVSKKIILLFDRLGFRDESAGH